MNDRAFYESFWQAHSADISGQLAIHTESRRPLLKLLERSLPENSESRFLEVGCGTALDSCLLLERRKRAQGVAVDLSVEAARIANKYAGLLGRNLFLAAADLNNLPFVENSFHLVFSQGVLEHFEDPTRAMQEQVRVLRPDGVLVVDVPQKFNLYTLLKKRAMREGKWPWGWETEYSVGELQGWAKPFGLEALASVGHQHGRLLDRMVIHPHRMLHNKLAAMNGGRRNPYQPGVFARSWEGMWDHIDSTVGPYLAINVAVAFRKAAQG